MDEEADNFGLLSQFATWTELHDNCDAYIQVGDAAFTKDFGPWKKGDKCVVLSLEYDKCRLLEYGSDGVTVVKEVKVKLEPID